MTTNVEAGVTPLPGGDEVHWSREEVGAEAAALFRKPAAERCYRVLTLTERDGTFSVYHAEVPGPWLHAFLSEWEDGVAGEGEQVLGLEAAG